MNTDEKNTPHHLRRRRKATALFGVLPPRPRVAPGPFNCRGFVRLFSSFTCSHALCWLRDPVFPGLWRKIRTSMEVSLLALTLLLSCTAGSAALAQGVYRPVERGHGRSAPQGQFPPVENRGNRRWSASQPLPSPRLPSTPASRQGWYYGYPYNAYSGQAPAGYGGYAPPGYGLTPPPPNYQGNRNPGFTPPSPNGFMNDLFGRRNELPSTYLPPPTPPLAAPVAPVYNPPIPQPAPQVPPMNQTAPAQPPEVAKPAPAPTLRKEKIKSPPPPPSPRPFADPEASGSAFPLRSVVPSGRNDPRFRPPELKGTP